MNFVLKIHLNLGEKEDLPFGLNLFNVDLVTKMLWSSLKALILHSFSHEVRE